MVDGRQQKQHQQQSKQQQQHVKQQQYQQQQQEKYRSPPFVRKVSNSRSNNSGSGKQTDVTSHPTKSTNSTKVSSSSGSGDTQSYSQQYRTSRQRKSSNSGFNQHVYHPSPLQSHHQHPNQPQHPPPKSGVEVGTSLLRVLFGSCSNPQTNDVGVEPFPAQHQFACVENAAGTNPTHTSAASAVPEALRRKFSSSAVDNKDVRIDADLELTEECEQERFDEWNHAPQQTKRPERSQSMPVITPSPPPPPQHEQFPSDFDNQHHYHTNWIIGQDVDDNISTITHSVALGGDLDDDTIADDLTLPSRVTIEASDIHSAADGFESLWKNAPPTRLILNRGFSSSHFNPNVGVPEGEEEDESFAIEQKYNRSQSMSHVRTSPRSRSKQDSRNDSRRANLARDGSGGTRTSKSRSSEGSPSTPRRSPTSQNARWVTPSASDTAPHHSQSHSNKESQRSRSTSRARRDTKSTPGTSDSKRSQHRRTQSSHRTSRSSHKTSVRSSTHTSISNDAVPLRNKPHKLASSTSTLLHKLDSGLKKLGNTMYSSAAVTPSPKRGMRRQNSTSDLGVTVQDVPQGAIEWGEGGILTDHAGEFLGSSERIERLLQQEGYGEI